MSVHENTEARKDQVVSLLEEVEEMGAARGPWKDAWRRLRKNKAALMGLTIIILYILMAIFAPYLAPQHYATQSLRESRTAPEWIINLFGLDAVRYDEEGQRIGGTIEINEDYIIGTDNLGRDLMSRIIYGSRVSLTVAFVGPIVSLLVGLLFGLISGYFGGQVDNIMMRVVDVMYAFPTILFIILLMAYFRASLGAVQPGTFAYEVNAIDTQFGGMLFIFIGVGLTSWMTVARLTRGQVLSIREQEYVLAARSIGSPGMSIIFRHVLPNILGPVIVAETLTIPTYISFEAFLSFIGLGVNPPTPSWGRMIADGSEFLRSYPYMAVFPGIALFLIMFAFNFLGDGLRDALDPRSQKG